MSAICGIFSLDGKPVRREEVAALMEPMAYWGPDGSEIWVEGPVGLGHLMLHTTPESVHEQLPLQNSSGNLVLTADARIDNRDELFDALGVEHSVRSAMPDSVLVLRAYEKWGEHCARWLVGDFTFVVWKRREQELFCCRDHMGTKPLFYFCSPKVFCFASAIKGILARPDVSRGLSDNRVAAFLVDIQAVGEETFYQDIRRLPPAHQLTVSATRMTTRRHWHPDEAPELRFSSTDDCVEACRDLFARCVGARLRSTGPVGIMLSGGLDSSSVAALAATSLKRSESRLLAYCSVPLKGLRTLVPKGRIADESPFVEALRQRYPNIDVTYVDAKGRTPLSDLESDFRVHDRPTRGVMNRYWVNAIFEEAEAAGVKALLDGSMGNVTISWKGTGVLAEAAVAGRWLAVARDLLHLRLKQHRPLARMILSQLVAPAAPSSVRRAYWRAHTVPSLLRASFIHRGFAREVRIADRLHADLAQYDGSSTARRAKYRIMSPTTAEFGDLRAARAASHRLELRDPTADRRLVELCLGLPERSYSDGGKERLLIRRVMQDALPEMIRENASRGAQAADAVDRVKGEVARLEEALLRFMRDDRVRRCLDLEGMSRALAEINHTERAQQAQLRQLLRCCSIGSFLVCFQ